MSKRTDQIIDDHLNQRPAVRRAYQHDPALRHQVEWARRLLAVMELVMQREGISADAGERVLNEVMHVGLGGWEQEKLSRERLLLLADWGGPTPAEALGWTERTLDEAFERNNAELRRAAERLSERPTTGEEPNG
jgi:hypothetical protein